MTHQTVHQILESVGDPAYSVDERGHLSGWNRPAENLLGHSKEEILGQPCHKILQGVDIFGNRYCEPDCPLLLMARRRVPIQHFEMDVRTRDDARLRILCFAFKVPGTTPGAFSVVHLLRRANPSSRQSLDQGLLNGPRLTKRELAVLRLLAGGHTTLEMAAILTVSRSTVRKHIQNILGKLDVHTRLAAVLAAFEKRIL